MPVGPDDTEQLLDRLEAELLVHQKAIDARLAREASERLQLENAAASWTSRRERAEAEIEVLTARRNAMIQRLDRLRLNGSKVSFLRARGWTGATLLLFLGAGVPLAVVAAKPQFFLVLILEAFGLLGGFGLLSWLDRGKDE